MGIVIPFRPRQSGRVDWVMVGSLLVSLAFSLCVWAVIAWAFL